ncbi:MAG: DUF368 domain-containing protein [Deltaproteobacteria bacterium]|nr:DUF368 domain-containing protein [Deltaproteobacteria bacterium]MBW1846121.1 DUF368 domain-containing protein [Deltaproteobacteria bacterium]MBW2180148.1 DUF368 domain-containing protein [Deltaproteobacteria bacterium]MBW2363760.1 DUF368 domain-containing protein [Deltaproteobacteria bacterium]
MKHIINGFIIGIANIIPGVSGGTFALILGIYPQLLRAIGTYNINFTKLFLNTLKTKQIKETKELLFSKDFYFLTQIFLGALISIALLSKIMKFLLENQYEITYGFFLGLIVFSIYIPYKLIDEKKFKNFIWLIVGVGLTLFISIKVDPSVKMIEKSQHYKEILEGVGSAAVLKNQVFEYIVICLTGMIAVSAMVLPGISGSFILLLFGKYYLVISAISRLHHLYYEDILLISSFGAGCIFGLAAFVKFFNYMYSKFKNQTIFFLIGLMIGSIYALWPFKKYHFIDLYIKSNNDILMVPGFKIYTNQLRLFDTIGQLWPVALSFTIGSIIMLLFIRYEKKQDNTKNEEST